MHNCHARFENHQSAKNQRNENSKLRKQKQRPKKYNEKQKQRTGVDQGLKQQLSYSASASLRYASLTLSTSASFKRQSNFNVRLKSNYTIMRNLTQTKYWRRNFRKVILWSSPETEKRQKKRTNKPQGAIHVFLLYKR